MLPLSPDLLTKLAPYLAKLTVRLIREHAPRSISTIAQDLPQGIDFDLTRLIPLHPAQNADVFVASADRLARAIQPRNKPELIVLLAITRDADRLLQENTTLAAHYELREQFYFGFFTLPFLWIRWLPYGIGGTVLAKIFSLEIRLHPYLHLLSGVGSMAVFARRRTRESDSVAVTCVIPAYNEAARLPRYLTSVIRYFKTRRLSHEILVVDDGSGDQTAKVAAALKPVRVLKLYENFGKGAAVREGIMHARGHVILVSDADGSTPIADFSRLEKALASEADIAIGSRYVAGSDIGIRQNFLRRAVSRVGNFLIRMLLELKYRDTQCGFKLFERRAAQYVFRNLANTRFGFDFEVLKKATVLGLNVAEIPVTWNNQDGSKVTLKQTFRVLSELLRFRFGHLMKFAVVGVFNTVVDFSIHNLLIWIWGRGDGTRQLIYMVIAFLCANIVAFSLHSGYTFQRRAAYGRFFLVSVFTLTVAALMFHGLNMIYNPENSIIWTNLFKLSTVIVSFVTNYFGYKFWVYRYAI